MWGCRRVEEAGPSGNGLMPSGNTSSSEPMLSRIYAAAGRHWGKMGLKVYPVLLCEVNPKHWHTLILVYFPLFGFKAILKEKDNKCDRWLSLLWI